MINYRSLCTPVTAKAWKNPARGGAQEPGLPVYLSAYLKNQESAEVPAMYFPGPRHI